MLPKKSLSLKHTHIGPRTRRGADFREMITRLVPRSSVGLLVSSSHNFDDFLSASQVCMFAGSYLICDNQSQNKFGHVIEGFVRTPAQGLSG